MSNKNFSIIKSVGLAIIICLVSVLILAVIVSLTGNSKIIKPVNQIIKAVSILLGCLFFLKEKGGLIKGLIVGVLFSTLTYLIFALFSGSLSFSLPFIIDIVFGGIIGMLSGIISVNVKRKKN